MRLPFISRDARYQAALDEIRGLRRRVIATEERHDAVEEERRTLARQLAEADAANRRLHGEVKTLTARLSSFVNGPSAAAYADDVAGLDFLDRGESAYKDWLKGGRP